MNQYNRIILTKNFTVAIETAKVTDATFIASYSCTSTVSFVKNSIILDFRNTLINYDYAVILRFEVQN